ncbi:hypothetical protein K469DRAFT_728442 [Zopfia rhizophila CBS 207.26]|uniref:NAD(P)-binding protein n=1 Tax=Zopfia rhizophila CBS 207.26 TaxID=1314779 RepID=A0A6A6DTE3_9PEZI|nr:hypothetical protein K469DRAFT_728442 [Zopfia rhizophila CBS 207.26]
MQAAKNAIAGNLGKTIPSHHLAPEDSQFSFEQISDLSGKVAIDIVDDALSTIKQEMGEATSKKVEWLQCDLSDWEQTGKMAFKITKKTDRLDILISNAARSIITQQFAKNGVDLTYGGEPYRARRLWAHGAVREIKVGGDPLLEYLARHLTSQYPNIVANAIRPGIVETGQSSEHIKEPYPRGGYLMSHGLSPFKKDIFEGAVSTMYAATVVEKSGGSDQANDNELGERLINLT